MYYYLYHKYLYVTKHLRPQSSSVVDLKGGKIDNNNEKTKNTNDQQKQCVSELEQKLLGSLVT